MEGFSSDSEGHELEQAVFVEPEETQDDDEGVETEGEKDTPESEESGEVVQNDLFDIPDQVPEPPARKGKTVPLRARRKAIPPKRNPNPKKRRFRPGTVALREIRKYQKSTENLLRTLPFRRLVREIAGDIIEDLKFTEKSLQAIQVGAEAYLVDLMERADFLAGYRKSITINPKDIRTAAFLLKDKHRPC